MLMLAQLSIELSLTSILWRVSPAILFSHSTDIQKRQTYLHACTYRWRNYIGFIFKFFVRPRRRNSVRDSKTLQKPSQFFRNPYGVSLTGAWIAVATKLFTLLKSSRRMEIIDSQEDISVKIYQIASTEDFWANRVLNKYMNCTYIGRKISYHVLGSTQICETSIFKMTRLKNNYHSRLTDIHLENTRRISCSSSVSNFEKLAQYQVCHFFH